MRVVYESLFMRGMYGNDSHILRGKIIIMNIYINTLQFKGTSISFTYEPPFVPAAGTVLGG